jgi:hypothetical protein
MWIAHCHFCTVAHADWMTGSIWQCQRCLFRIPAAHVWWWCPLAQERAETNTEPQMYAQKEMEL